MTTIEEQNIQRLFSSVMDLKQHTTETRIPTPIGNYIVRSNTKDQSIAIDFEYATGEVINLFLSDINDDESLCAFMPSGEMNVEEKREAMKRSD